MRILHLLQSSTFSGAENVVCQIISLFKEDDVEMIYSSADGPIREALSERKIIFEPMTELCISEVKRVVAKVRPDIIHAHDMRASFVATMATCKVPIVSHIHNNCFDSRGITVKSLAYLPAALRARHIFWVSQSAYNGYFFKKLCRKKSSVLMNVINIEEARKKAELDKNEYSYDCVYLGRLTYPKNPERLMTVIKKVVSKKKDTKFAVIGSGDLEASVRELCREYGLEGNVDFLGFVQNPLKILQSAKVMVMTSRWEGTPMCALEALGLGVPIVSTPVDGLKEIIRNGENGYLSDNDEELAEKILGIIEDTGLAELLGRSTKASGEALMDINKYKKAVFDSYKEIERRK